MITDAGEVKESKHNDTQPDTKEEINLVQSLTALRRSSYWWAIAMLVLLLLARYYFFV